jgi:hypothetical protein
MKVISKAQEKRNKDKFNLLSNRMQARLVDFKNTYIGDFVRYEEHQIERIANAFKGSDMEVVKKNVVGRSIQDVRKEGVFSSVELSLFFCAKNNSYYGYDDRITDIQIDSVERAQRKLELIELHKVEFYAEALKSYDTKFKKLIDGMMKHDFDRNLVIEDVNQQGGHFEILVYNPTKYTRDEQERIELSKFFYHARIIYACGDIVRPHFRFITTTRKTYTS